MLTIQEQAQLNNFKGMGSMSQAQAVEYHDLMVKEADPIFDIPVEAPVVEKKKKGKK